MKIMKNIKTHLTGYRLIIVILVAALIFFNPSKSPILLPIMMGLEIVIKSIIGEIFQAFKHQGSEAVKRLFTSFLK